MNTDIEDHTFAQGAAGKEIIRSTWGNGLFCTYCYKQYTLKRPTYDEMIPSNMKSTHFY